MIDGKAPVIVFDDAELSEVVAGIRTFGNYNAGQDRTAAWRIYAGAKIYDNLVAEARFGASGGARSVRRGARLPRSPGAAAHRLPGRPRR